MRIPARAIAAAGAVLALALIDIGTASAAPNKNWQALCNAQTTSSGTTYKNFEGTSRQDVLNQAKVYYGHRSDTKHYDCVSLSISLNTE